MSGTPTATPPRTGQPTTDRGRGMTARVDGATPANAQPSASIYNDYVRAGRMLVPRDWIGPVGIPTFERDATGSITIVVEVWPRQNPMPAPALTLTQEDAAIFLMDTQHPAYDAQHHRLLPIILEAALSQGRALITGSES